MFTTALAFWTLVADQQDVGLLMQSEKIARSFVDVTKLKIDAGDLTAGDLAKSNARLSQVEAQRIGSEFRLLQSRHNLSLSMGLEGDEFNDPPFASGSLPPGGR